MVAFLKHLVARCSPEPCYFLLLISNILFWNFNLSKHNRTYPRLHAFSEPALAHSSLWDLLVSATQNAKVIRCTEWKENLTHFVPQRWNEVGVQLHASALKLKITKYCTINSNALKFPSLMQHIPNFPQLCFHTKHISYICQRTVGMAKLSGLSILFDTTHDPPKC